MDLSKVIEIDMMKGDSSDETKQLIDLSSEAKEYISEFDWCKSIKEMYFGDGVAGIFAIFLVRIIPSKPEVDEWLWIIVGDLPPAYLVTDDASDPKSALESYIFEMNEWVKAVRNGTSLEDCIPVNVPPTKEYANQLDSRLNFLKREFCK